MDRFKSSHHISHQFDNELEDIRNRVLVMGGLVEEQLRDAISALFEDSVAAEKVLANDYRINQFEIDIDRVCSQILARRQPTASDLRLVIGVGKAISDLERIGDEAQLIARKTEKILIQESKRYYPELKSLTENVLIMLHEALDVFARMDVKAAVEVAYRDVKIDNSYGSVLTSLVEEMEDKPEMVRRTVELMWVTRALERIGDHARNICEHVIFIGIGKDVRHVSLDQMQREVARVSP